MDDVLKNGNDKNREIDYFLDLFEMRKDLFEDSSFHFVSNKTDLLGKAEEFNNEKDLEEMKKKIERMKEISKKFHKSKFHLLSCKKRGNNFLEEIVRERCDERRIMLDIWKPNKESTLKWGKQFGDTVHSLLICNKRLKIKLPKFVIFLILQILSEMLIFKKEICIFENKRREKKKNKKKIKKKKKCVLM